MSYIRQVAVEFTTDGDGDATVFTDAINGRVLSVVYTYDDAATGADLTITTEDTGRTVITVTNAGTSSTSWNPRVPTVDTSAAAETYDSTEAVNDYLFVANERIKIVVAEGGNAKSGTITVVYG